MEGKIWKITVLCFLLTTVGVGITPTCGEETPEWTEDIRLTKIDNNSSTYARTVSDSMNNLHIVWVDYRHGPPELYYMKLDDKGNIAVDEKLFTDLDAATSYEVDVACDSNDYIHVLWSDIRDSGPIPNIELYYEKLDAMGNTIVDEMRITNAPHNSLYASIAMDSWDNIHVVWSEEINVMSVLQEEIYYTKLDNNGNTLVDDMALTGNDGEESLFPDIAVDSNDEVHIVWLDDRNETGSTKCQDVYYTKLNNVGQTIVDDSKLFVRADHFRPNIVIDSSDMIHMTCGSIPGWKGNVYKQLYYMKLDVNGNPVVDELRLTNDEGNASHPALHLDSEENVHIVLEDERHNNSEIYYIILDNQGNTLEDELRLTINTSRSMLPVIEMHDNDRVQVVWADGRDYTDTDYRELYHKFYPKIPPNIIPTVAITSPSELQTVSGDVLIEGEAGDIDGIIEYVEVKVPNYGWITAEGTTSWYLEWNSSLVENGLITIYAKSFDGTNYSYEGMINVTVDNAPIIPPNNPPTVTITPMQEIVSGTVVIKGSASDSDGNVQKVQVKIDAGGWMTASGKTSWSYPWDTTLENNGEHVIFARAEDDDKEQSERDSIVLIVENKVNTPPEVDIIYPTVGTVSETVVIRGTSYDVDGENTITSVQVRIHEDWEEAQGTKSWSFSWDTTNLDDGEYTIFARAFDGMEYSLESSLAVRVDNPHSPTLTVTSDIPDEASGTITIQGTASDIDGKIEKIEIKIDEGRWEEVEASKFWIYELDTTRLSDGGHVITIRITDDEGESEIRTVIIDVNNPEESQNWVFLLGIIFTIIIVIIIISVLATRKSSSKKGYRGYSREIGELQIAWETLKCNNCGTAFKADLSWSQIQCPNCKARGTV